MKFVSAVTALVAAFAVGSEAAKKTTNKRVSRRELNSRMKKGQFDKATLMKNARPHSADAKKRHLDSLELTGAYSIQFESCFSFTTSYEDVFEDDENYGMMNLFSSGNIMPVQSYAIFRLCYGTSCYANGNEALLEYVIDLNTYVQALVNYLPEQMEGFCEACQENEDSCLAILYGQYGQQYQGDMNANAYKYQNYNAGDNNYNGNNVNNVNYQNAQYGYYANGNGNRKLSDFEQRVLEGGQVVRQLDCQLCEEYSCLDDDDGNDMYGFEAASEWLQEIAECKETGIAYQGGYGNNGGQYYQQNQGGDENEIYAGVICNAEGTGIELGLFYDEECKLYLPNEAYSNYMSYFEQTYQQMTKEIVEFTFSDAVFSCKEQEIIYTTQDLSQYNGYYEQQDWNGDDDDIAEWCEVLVSGEISEPIDMSSCGMYSYYANGGYYQGQNMNNNNYEEKYQNYQNQDQASQYMYQYDWYRYEISEDDSLDMMEVCKLTKQLGGELHTYYNTNNGNLYSYSGSGASETIEDFLENTESSLEYGQSSLSAGAKFGIVALVGGLLGAVVALFLRFKASTEDDKNVGLIDPDETESAKGEVA